MTRDEFIRLAVSSGYCNKRAAREYAGERDVFTVEDFVEVSRRYERSRELIDRESARGRFGDHYRFGMEGTTTKQGRNPGDDRYVK